MNEPGDSDAAPFSELVPLAPLGTPRAAPLVGPWTARLWVQVVGLLPVLFMGLLAALTWWLVKNSPLPGEDVVKPPPRHEPDYTMRDFAVSSFDASGVLRSRLEGDVLMHYPDTDTVEIEGVRLRAEDLQGRVTVGTAQRALSNGDATQVRLMGGARVVREPGPKEAPTARIEIRGEFLELFTDTERIRSHLPVTVLTGRGEVHAGRLDYSHLDRIGQFGGRVTGVLRPAPKAAP